MKMQLSSISQWDDSFYKITGITDPWYKYFRQIYEQSFPVHEQRNEQQQTAAFTNKQYNLLAKIENTELTSFISYWNFENYVYIEHLAVNPDLEGEISVVQL